ncbi:hypothetical protein [Mycoplasma leonicaptivi]|uniref:hypothetical protein n=1 Tax=Mycoplasma leonicaptivi TaxID=36742 RepID=UPI0004809234|nr:hypothetical protein [Mycoplasma leonicaptivi]
MEKFIKTYLKAFWIVFFILSLIFFILEFFGKKLFFGFAIGGLFSYLFFNITILLSYFFKRKKLFLYLVIFFKMFLFLFMIAITIYLAKTINLIYVNNTSSDWWYGIINIPELSFSFALCFYVLLIYSLIEILFKKKGGKNERK